MNLVLHIQITQDLLTFENQLQNWLLQNAPEFYYFGLDNHSETPVVHTALKAIDEAEYMLVIIEAEPAIPPGPVLKVVKKLATLKNNVFTVVCKGHHQLISKMERGFKTRWNHCTDQDELKTILADILKKQH